jgi:citrate lyase subunit beta/citryl-CoA lyase
MKTLRSILFVPGCKPKWFEKISSSGADGVILDLEDSVPLHLKSEARTLVSDKISILAQNTQQIFVRINRSNYSFDLDDLEAVIQPNLAALVLPKVNGPEDIEHLSNLIADIEIKKNLQVGTTKFIASLETARSIYLAYEIACKDRVISLAGISTKNGDVSRSVGFQWTPEGLETLYIKSKVVLAARAAGITPIGGIWQDVHEFEGLRKSAQLNRQLGFSGELVLHPSNVSIINEIYTPSDEEINYYRGMIEAFDIAEREGRSAILYDGEHIDYAHIKTAKEVLKLASNLKKNK